MCSYINPGSAKNRKLVSPIFLDYYEKKISEGKTKHQAILHVMTRNTNIIYGLMKNKTRYIHSQDLSDKYQEIQRDRIDKERLENEKN